MGRITRRARLQLGCRRVRDLVPHPARLPSAPGARPRRDAVEKYLRRAVADAMLAEVSLHRGEFVVCGDELLLRPIPELATGYVFAG